MNCVIAKVKVFLKWLLSVIIITVLFQMGQILLYRVYLKLSSPVTNNNLSIMTTEEKNKRWHYWKGNSTHWQTAMHEAMFWYDMIAAYKKLDPKYYDQKISQIYDCNLKLITQNRALTQRLECCEKLQKLTCQVNELTKIISDRPALLKQKHGELTTKLTGIERFLDDKNRCQNEVNLLKNKINDLKIELSLLNETEFEKKIQKLLEGDLVENVFAKFEKTIASQSFKLSHKRKPKDLGAGQNSELFDSDNLDLLQLNG